MFATLIMGGVLGFVAGIVPGPYVSLVAATTLEHGGKAGRRTALAPLATELPALVLAGIVLSQLPSEVLRWVGLGGAGLLIYVAWTVFSGARERRAGKGSAGAVAGSESPDDGVPRRLLEVVLIGLMSPGPWVFWFFLGGPLLMNRWHVGPLHAVGFVGAFLALFVGVLLALAFAVESGSERVEAKWHRRSLYGVAGLMVVAALVLGWQSWAGNFGDLVLSPEMVEDQLP